MKYKPDLNFIYNTPYSERKSLYDEFPAFCVDTNEVDVLAVYNTPDGGKLVIPEYYVQVTDKSGDIIRPNPEFVIGENSEARKLWHDALISGKYKQGRGRMMRGILFCCLGVGECIFNESYDEDSSHPSMDSKFIKSIHVTGQLHNVTSDFADPYIGLDNGKKVMATQLNDGYELDFKQIAKLVYPEAYYSLIEV